MPDITDSVIRYREAARHLWNTSFCGGAVDWDELAHRDFTYVQVQIVRSPQHNELVGRFALLEFGHVRFQLLDGAT